MNCADPSLGIIIIIIIKKQLSAHPRQDHREVLRVHQVRYGVDLLPYDLAWNFAGLALLAVGAVLLRRARHGASR